MPRRLRSVSVLLTLCLAAAACGQKNEVGREAADGRTGSPVTTAPPATGLAPGGDGLDTTTTTTAAAATDTTATTAAPGATATTATTAARAGAARGTSPTTRTGTVAPSVTTSPPASGAAGPVDRTGVSDSEIVIGIHAPVTGAAPIRQDTFERSRDIYWNYLKARGGIFGRNVRVVFQDDRFDPAHARTVCREMVEKDKVFMLIGVAGSDQITACARYAAEAGVPYLSAGVNEDGMVGLPNYLALSMSYQQQAPLLAQLVKNRLKKTKVAIVLNDSPSLDDTHDAIVKAVKGAGLQVVHDSRINKNANPTEAAAKAQQVSGSQAEAVVLLVAPAVFLQLVRSAPPTFRPFWVGPGLTNGINLVAELGCASSPDAVDGKAQFLSPFVQMDVIDQYDPEYRKAYEASNPGEEPDDIGLGTWGLSKGLAQMLEAAGRDLSRQSFLAGALSGREFATNIFPAVRYSDGARFGASASHLLVVDCATRAYKTAAAFATGF